jgi:hypothetical protein
MTFLLSKDEDKPGKRKLDAAGPDAAAKPTAVQGKNPTNLYAERLRESPSPACQRAAFSAQTVT